MLLVGLLVVVACSAFGHGATSAAAEAWLQLALALGTVATSAAWLWGGGLRARAPTVAWAGVALLAGYAIWSGVSMAWSITPDNTWTELNRAITYVLVLVLALVAGASQERGVERAAFGYLVVAVLVALYALGGKVAPEIHLGPLNLDTTSVYSRIDAPIDYWNGLALVLALASPIALRLAVDETRRRGARLVGLGALFVLLLVIGLTYSRGGVLALVIALAVGVGLAHARLRSLLALALSLVATVPALAFAFTSSALTTDGLSVGQRIGPGAKLGAIALAGLVLLVLAWMLAMAFERRVAPDAVRSRRLGLVLAGCVAVLVIAGVADVAQSRRGLAGSVSHQVHQFTRPQGVALTDPHRLLATSSNNRWVWWNEAVGAFSGRPLLGAGAGSFPVLHTEYRTNDISVLQAHSFPLQLLAETGVVGLLLALGGLALLWAAIAWVRRLPPGGQRALAAALAGAAVAFFLHGFYDWEWEIPGVTLPAILFLGVLAGSAGRERGRGRVAASGPTAPLPGELGGARVVALVAVSALMVGVFASAALPALAASKAGDAVVAAGDARDPAQVRAAGAEAELAARLDPASSDPLVAEAQIAQHQRRYALADQALRTAVARNPSDIDAWEQLGALELNLGDAPGAVRAARRALAIDPRAKLAQALARQALAAQSPPGRSATAVGTPLPAAGR